MCAVTYILIYVGYNLDGFCKEFAGILMSSKNPSDTKIESNCLDGVLLYQDHYTSQSFITTASYLAY